MGRIAIHIHGLAKEKAYREMLKNYGDRIKSRGISIVFHKSKKSLVEYFTEINSKAGLFLLDESGMEYTSRNFTKLIKQWIVCDRDINLAIGPVDGWGEYKLQTANLIALSKMTFPHELAAVMLVEQVYRATEIIKGTNYHRD